VIVCGGVSKLGTETGGESGQIPLVIKTAAPITLSIAKSSTSTSSKMDSEDCPNSRSEGEKENWGIEVKLNGLNAVEAIGIVVDVVVVVVVGCGLKVHAFRVFISIT